MNIFGWILLNIHQKWPIWHFFAILFADIIIFHLSSTTKPLKNIVGMHRCPENGQKWPKIVEKWCRPTHIFGTLSSYFDPWNQLLGPNWVFSLTLDISRPIYMKKDNFSFFVVFWGLRGVGFALISSFFHQIKTTH